MLENRLQHMEESYKVGIQLLEQKDYNAAIQFFRRKLESGTPKAHDLAHYGLATALYLKKNVSLTRKETEEIISHYQKSIAQNPNFPDAYFMCSLAYDRLASTYIDEGKTNEEHRTRMLAKAREALATARQHLTKATGLNPNFRETATKYEKSYKITENAIRAVEMFKKSNH